MELGQNFNISEMFTVVQIYIYLNPKTKVFLQRCGIHRKNELLNEIKLRYFQKCPF